MKDRAYEIALNPKYDRYQRGLPSGVYKFFDKKKKRIGSRGTWRASSRIAQTSD